MTECDEVEVLRKRISELEAEIEQLKYELDSETKWAGFYLEAFIKMRDAATSYIESYPLVSIDNLKKVVTEAENV